MKTIKLSDYVVKTLAEYGIRHVFMVTGGGAMHLNDSFGKNPDLKYFCFHHEQACAMAAESYARLTGKMAAVNVTTGPGGINALNGVYGAWTDSIPMIIVSGQVRYDTTIHSSGLPLRQLGDQEVDIVRCVEPITKSAVMITDAKDIRYHLERALYLAEAGRPGPTWIDIPLNIQGAAIDPEDLRLYDAREDLNERPPIVSRELIMDVIGRIRGAKRPVLMAGSGIRISKAHEDFLKAVELLGIPVVTGFNAHDLITDANRFSCGRPGSIGNRFGNFTVQNSDVLLVIGCRLNIRQISYNWKSFAREAYKIVVDADPWELRKPTINPDLPVHADAADFLKMLVEVLTPDGLTPKEEWGEWCRARKKRYPVVLPEYWDRTELVNPYCFIDALNRHLIGGETIVTANATACICAFQALEIKPGQRLYSNSGSASMGYDLPAAIGAAIAGVSDKIVCVAGDGSIQMNLQELQTIVHHNFPIKIFVLNNGGYHSIRQTQANFFNGHFVGCDMQSGVSFPDMERIAYAYGIPFVRCHNHAELDRCIARTLEGAVPAICEIMITPDQPFAPRISSKRLPDGRIVSAPLEDMYPFLDRAELKENLFIAPLEE
jgi:acetolactate synthase-1/2/3 large subunit